jgi:pyruvate,water dikinase
VAPGEVDSVKLTPGDILVCQNTDIRYFMLMKQAAAIVTEKGGMLTHAAIAARELGKPCVVACGGLLARVHTGDEISIDGKTGVVRFRS